jgi:peptidoglycan/LPS O-acetylase OafA/YrhL
MPILTQKVLHNPNLKYMAQLDSVRFAAVCMVLVQHLLGYQLLPFGHLGVLLFFVLSGFLITGILLRERERIDAGGMTRKGAMCQFYIRRILRIFPLYYGVVLLLGIVCNVADGRRLWAWLLTYTMNYQVWLNHEGPVWSVFWSLAVEEHFYFLWPAVILLAPARLRIPATLALIVSGPLWRTLALKYGVNLVGVQKFDLGCFDSLGLGALLVQVHRSEQWRGLVLKALDWFLLPCSVIVSAVLFTMARLDIAATIAIVLSDISIGIVFCWIVSKASIGFKGRTGRLLSFRPLLYGGRITYGIYVYHGLCFWALAWLARKAGLQAPGPGWKAFALVFPATIVLSALSWHWFELPFNNLKDRWAR